MAVFPTTAGTTAIRPATQRAIASHRAIARDLRTRRAALRRRPRVKSPRSNRPHRRHRRYRPRQVTSRISLRRDRPANLARRFRRGPRTYPTGRAWAFALKIKSPALRERGPRSTFPPRLGDGVLVATDALSGVGGKHPSPRVKCAGPCLCSLPQQKKPRRKRGLSFWASHADQSHATAGMVDDPAVPRLRLSLPFSGPWFFA
jgi:hypothetical protein